MLAGGDTGCSLSLSAAQEAPVPLSNSTGSTGPVGRAGDFATDPVKTVLAVTGRARGRAERSKQPPTGRLNPFVSLLCVRDSVKRQRELK